MSGSTTNAGVGERRGFEKGCWCVNALFRNEAGAHFAQGCTKIFAL